MSLKKTVIESHYLCDNIKSEPLDPQNASGQNIDGLDTACDFIKSENNNECFSEVKVKE